MTRTNSAPRRAVRRRRFGLAAIVFAAAAAGWRAEPEAAHGTRTAPAAAAATPVNYGVSNREEPSSRAGFPIGAVALSGPEITAALSDHTALLAGGFVEYYAPDGSLHGLAEEKHYGGSWDVRGAAFCTLLEGSDATVCSPVEREGDTLYWSLDGEREASPVATLPGNPRGLR